MVVGVARISLKLFDVFSLKGKRRIINSMKSRLANRFNASVAETGKNDSLEWGEIAIAMAGKDAGRINSQLDKALNMAENMGLAMIADTSIEIIHL
jgi:uncharacterized protein YlxP (DUF503 family)